MTSFRVRSLHHDDLDAVLHLWTEQRTAYGDPVYALSEVLASCDKDHAVVAVRDQRVVGVAVGRAAHDQGWIVFLGTAAETGDEAPDITAALLAELEADMAGAGLSKLSVLLPGHERPDGHEAALAARGFSEREHLRYLERTLPVRDEERALLASLGGRMLPRDLWQRIGGMSGEKALIEQRLITPLARPEVAERYGVVPPRAVVLFGPPGTGKTTFAKAIASRLDWPFVELFPSRLADGGSSPAAALRGAFEEVSRLENVVVFIDEVEEIAARRGSDPPSPTQGVTNELLKLIPAFRDRAGRLLICATNFIRALDDALLRHGRFDYVIPIGLPDGAARTAIWQTLVPAGVRDGLDLASVVAASAGFSPADIEHAARQASQAALDAALRSGRDPLDQDGPSTAHYLDAVASTRATVSAAVASEFAADIERLARL